MNKTDLVSPPHIEDHSEPYKKRSRRRFKEQIFKKQKLGRILKKYKTCCSFRKKVDKDLSIQSIIKVPHNSFNQILFIKKVMRNYILVLILFFKIFFYNKSFERNDEANPNDLVWPAPTTTFING